MHGFGGNFYHLRPLLGISYRVLGFVRGSSTGEKDDFIKLGCVARLLGNFKMATMDGVETASEDCNFLFQGGGAWLRYVI